MLILLSGLGIMRGQFNGAYQSPEVMIPVIAGWGFVTSQNGSKYFQLALEEYHAMLMERL